MDLEYEQRLEESRQFWNNEAEDFDNEPDHGLSDPVVHKAWYNLLVDWLPSTPSVILDIGCGTGSLSVLLSELGHEVIGIDLSPVMIAKAREKAKVAGQVITFAVMDASAPDFAHNQFDVIVCRHVLWALPEPTQVLQRWVDMLTSSGRLVMVEGYWHTGGGLHSTEILDALPSSLTGIHVQNLSSQSALWGGEVTDERYIVVAEFGEAADN